MARPSPDLNPVEDCWVHIAEGLVDRSLANTYDLFRGSEEIRRAKPQSFIQSLYSSLPTRVAAVLAVNGGHTNC